MSDYVLQSKQRISHDDQFPQLAIHQATQEIMFFKIVELPFT